MLYYADTMQAKAMKLMASKLSVAGIIEGSISEEGLAAMSDVKDLTSQMAKELALGIKDNVEDIAAAFKKMAIINPNKTRRPPQSQAIPIHVEDQPAIMELPAPTATEVPKIKTADAQQKQALYEGLLAKTIEERKKKKSRKEVDENQLSFFDFVA